MAGYNSFVVFITIWIVVFFMVLPLKDRWPSSNTMRRKLLWATVISLVVWVILDKIGTHCAPSIMTWLRPGSAVTDALAD